MRSVRLHGEPLIVFRIVALVCGGVSDHRWQARHASGSSGSGGSRRGVRQIVEPDVGQDTPFERGQQFAVLGLGPRRVTVTPADPPADPIGGERDQADDDQ